MVNEGRIPLVGVIGSPIEHSRSPALHEHWLKTHGIRGHYIPMNVGHGDLKQVILTMPRMGFVGLNVTIPYKEAVLELADFATDRAAMIGCANTLIFREDGKIHADNTDGHGFIENLRSGAPEWLPQEGPAVVFGAGGASRAVIASLIETGTPEIRVSNRTRTRAEEMRSRFGTRVEVVDWISAGNAVDDAVTVVNTTSLGMQGMPDFRVPLDGLQPGMVVTDLVYNPVETAFLKAAREAGCQTVDGLGMLIHQAVPGFERWFGIRPEADEAARKAVMPQ